jgi:hydrogenase small subunit
MYCVCGTLNLLIEEMIFVEKYSRRDILRMGTALAAGLGLGGSYSRALAEGLEKIVTRNANVLWLQAMSCTGCSVSFLNVDSPGPVEVLTEIISLVYHQTISAAQGEDVQKVIDQLTVQGNYYVIVEGAVPLDMPTSCVMGGKPAATLLPPVLRNAKAILAMGTCAAFGGIPSAEGSVTTAGSVRSFMERNGIPTEGRLLNCPGCPTHPQSILGALAYVISKGYPKVDPKLLTPDMLYKHSVHDECPRFHYWGKEIFAEKFGDEGCLFKLGCLGPLSRTHCPRSQWNGGVNWCIRAGAPCTACTSESFAKRRDFPFYRKSEAYHSANYSEAERRGTQS